MKTLKTLRNNAATVTAARGHRIKWGQPYGNATSNLSSQNGECKCGAEVTIHQHPDPNQCEIAGSALALNHNSPSLSVGADKVADGWGDSPETRELKRISRVFADIAKKYPDAIFSVKHSGYYSHKYCTDFDIKIAGDDETQITDAEIEKVEESLKENSRDFMEWIYRQLESAYEHHNSDENVDENIRINGYDFTEDGDCY